jgi:hypothetical protein
MEHWHYEPILCGGVEHCGFCGAIIGDLREHYAIWIRTRLRLGLPVGGHKGKEIQ